MPESSKAGSLETHTAAIARWCAKRAPGGQAASRSSSVEMRTRAHPSIEASTLRPIRLKRRLQKQARFRQSLDVVANSLS
jgi:hypothetical protein